MGKKKDKKSVYILLTRTETVPSRVIHFFKRMPYVHVSIALDEELDELYSFARKKIRNPFRCGFIDEDINSGIFARDTETKCQVLRLKLTERQYQDVKRSIEVFKSDRESTNTISLASFLSIFILALKENINIFALNS